MTKELHIFFFNEFAGIHVGLLSFVYLACELNLSSGNCFFTFDSYIKQYLLQVSLNVLSRAEDLCCE